MLAIVQNAMRPGCVSRDAPAAFKGVRAVSGPAAVRRGPGGIGSGATWAGVPSRCLPPPRSLRYIVWIAVILDVASSQDYASPSVIPPAAPDVFLRSPIQREASGGV